MKTKRIILFLAAAALFTGCFKDVSYKTTYVFKPLEQEKSGDPTQILAAAKLYAFAADTSSWEVASYKDALAGVISQRGNRNEKISTPVSYTHLTLPTSDLVEISVGAGTLKKKQK